MRTVRAPLGLVSMLVFVTIGWSATSEAVTYSFSGTCTTACDEIGLDVGGAVSGSISFGALVPGSPYPAPTSFAFDFGTVEISDAITVELGLFAVPLPGFPTPPSPALVPTDLSSFAAELHLGEAGAAPVAVLAISPAGSWSSTADGGCLGTDCSFPVTRGEFAEGSGAWSTGPGGGGAPGVPSPAALALLVVGGAAFAWWGRGQRISAAQRSSTGSTSSALAGFRLNTTRAAPASR